MDIYEYFAQRLDCYQSDLLANTSLFWDEAMIQKIPQNQFSIHEWNNFLGYLFFQEFSFSDVQEAKECLIRHKCQ